MDLKENARRGIYLLPNLFTLASLLVGFYAIIAALDGYYENAAIAIFVAMVLDGLDGRVARLTNTMTVFGAEFDSLVDMVAFGVAPALLMYEWALSNLDKIGWLTAFIYIAAVALRLARFNTQIGAVNKRYFQGLSCTAGAGVIAGMVWLGKELAVEQHSIALGLAFLTVIVGILMVSNIRYRSFKDLEFKDHVPFLSILLTVFIVVLISLEPAKVLFSIFAIYAISGPVATVWALRKRRKLRREIQKKNMKHEA